MLSNHVRLIGLALMMGLLFRIMMAPSVLAREIPQSNKKIKTQVMHDGHANNDGVFGFATARRVQEGNLVFDKGSVKTWNHLPRMKST